VSSAETVTASGKNPTAIGQARDVTVNNDNSQTNIWHTRIKVYSLADVSKLNALQRHQDALLIAEHPTKLTVTNADFVHWLSDSELFLTITLSNVSKLPAFKVEYGISDQMHSGPSKAPRFVAIEKSASIPKNRKLEYWIEPEDALITPLIGISDLRKFLNLRPDYCIVMTRVVDGVRKFPNLPFKQGQWGSATDYAVPLAYIYQSIFEQKYIANTLLSVIVARRDSLVPPGPNDSESYPQCRD
jgi:hypothetical protein